MQDGIIDKKDRHILYELSLNARISLTALAKRLRLSKQVVAYRISQLESKGIIQGYHAITNIYMLGMTHYRIFVKYHNIDTKKEEEIIAYLSKHPRISWIAELDGDLDLAFLVWAENIREFEKYYDEINARFGAYFQKKIFNIATRIEYMKYGFLLDKENNSSIIFGDCYAKEILDALDHNIIISLNNNARASLVDLAIKYNTSAKVIKSHIDRLLSRKILLGFNIKIDHRKLGFTHRKILLKLKDMSDKKMMKISQFLRSKSYIIYLVKPVGEYDLEFEVMTRSNEEFHYLLKEFRSAFAEDVLSYDSVILYYEPKSGQITAL